LGTPKTGPTSFGYRRENGKWVADEKEAPIRLRMFELFAEHGRKKTVAEILNYEGHRTRNDVIFSAQTVGRLLSDKIVLGIEGEVDQIISQDLWDRCQSIFDQNKAAGGAKRKAAHLFSGYAHCVCGQKMYVPTNSPKYVCSDCRNKIAKDDLELIFKTQLKNYELPEKLKKQKIFLTEKWNSLSFDRKRGLIESITHRIEIDDNKVTCFLISL